jgi:predicted Zn-dependent protease
LCLVANTADAANCGEGSGSAAVSACDQELARDPGSIEMRLRYADVLMGQRQYQQALNILKDALTMQPGNDTVKQKYRLASSLAEEQQSID